MKSLKYLILISYLVLGLFFVDIISVSANTHILIEEIPSRHVRNASLNPLSHLFYQYSDSNLRTMQLTCSPNSINVGTYNGLINTERLGRRDLYSWNQWQSIYSASEAYNQWFKDISQVYWGIYSLNYTVITSQKSVNALYNFNGNINYSIPSVNANNLIPNSKYLLGLRIDSYRFSPNEDSFFTNGSGFILPGSRLSFYDFGYWAGETRYGSFFDIYTTATRPIISASDIKDVRASINWNANGNPSGTSYTLQRRVPGQAWANRYTGTLNTFTDTGLNNETTYHYRVVVNHIAGSNWNTTSWQNGLEHLIVTTTADPAVAAAQEAASRAAAAEEAAKQTLQYAQDAKVAAQEARNKAQEVYDLVDSLDLSNELSHIKSMIVPSIQKVSSVNGATAALGQSFQITISASGIQNSLKYRVICDDFDSGWVSNNIIDITGLYNSGIKTAKIYVSNNPDEPDLGGIASTEFNFFKLTL